MGLFLLFLDPEGYPTFFCDSSPTFLHKNPKSSQERAMELVPGLFYIIFHGEPDKTTQTPWNIARTRENHTPRFFQIFSLISRSTPFSKKRSLKKAPKNSGKFLGGSGGTFFHLFRFLIKRNNPKCIFWYFFALLASILAGKSGCSPLKIFETFKQYFFANFASTHMDFLGLFGVNSRRKKRLQPVW